MVEAAPGIDMARESVGGGEVEVAATTRPEESADDGSWSLDCSRKKKRSWPGTDSRIKRRKEAVSRVR